MPGLALSFYLCSKMANGMLMLEPMFSIEKTVHSCVDLFLFNYQDIQIRVGPHSKSMFCMQQGLEFANQW